MSPTLRKIYGDHYRAMPTPQLWEESQALFADHSVSAELSTRKFRLVVIELTRRGIVFLADEELEVSA